MLLRYNKIHGKSFLLIILIDMAFMLILPFQNLLNFHTSGKGEEASDSALLDLNFMLKLAQQPVFH